MEEFKLDVSGYIDFLNPNGDTSTISWPDLSPIERGYTRAMFSNFWANWCAKFAKEVKAGRFTHQDAILPPSFSDLAGETFGRIREDCTTASSDPAIIGVGVYNAELMHAVGIQLWRDRQNGLLPGYPPIEVYLDSAGKMRFQ